jgi:outer membrane protein OmpA-like peptidoglycan-associated protein
MLEPAAGVHFPTGQTQIETLPPTWRNDMVPVRLGFAKATQNNTPVVVPAVQLDPVVAQLSTGVAVMFTSSTQETQGSSSSRVMRVVLSPKNFLPAYDNYRQCANSLIHYGFKDVALSFVLYGEKPDGLTSANKAILKNTIRYVKADAGVLGIFVDGHSDEQATPEEAEAQSKQMAEAVAAYMVEQGLAADKFTTRWHSDKFPLADNKLPAGKMKNRRVTVRLENAASRAEAEKKLAAKKIEEAKEAARVEEEEKKKAAAAEKASSSHAKMTPEQINKMVEGLDLIKGK